MIGSTFNLLVIEDDADDAFFLRQTFSKVAPHVPMQLLGGGDEAIAYLSGRGQFANRELHPLPNMIVMDLNMPRLGGFDVLQWIKHHPRLSVIPITILTASPSLEDISRAYREGANAYFLKPTRLEELETVAGKIMSFWLEAQKPGLEVLQR